jgi:hypothetical protein
MVTQTRGSNARRDSRAGRTSVTAELQQARELLAQRTRERDALKDERDALSQQMHALTEEYTAAIAQWRRRCEACLDVRIESAAGANGHVLIPSNALPIDAERIIAEKDEYILHLESLLTANPISLMGSWLTLRWRRAVKS